MILENFSRFLKKFHFSISILRHFHFTFHFSKRVNQIFISLFTSRKQWNRFSFHFSLLEFSIYPLSQGPGGSSHTLFCSRSSLAKSYSLCPTDTAVEPCCLPIWRRSWIPPLSESNVVQLCAVWPKQISLLSSECTFSPCQFCGVLLVWKLEGREIGLCLYILQLIWKLS